MFKSKLEVDRHVNNSLKNINSDTQRCLRGYSFAKLYFSVGDYEQACRYVKSYLSVKPKSAEAYVLLGKCLEKLTKVEAALDAYRNALEIEPKHNNVIIKVCELMASDNADLDLSGARYFCDLAQSFDPSNSAVYCLKEKLISKGNENPSSVIEFLLQELESRPTDINLRIRLLRNYLQNNMVLEAYKHASAVEEKHFFILSESLSWYEVVAEVLHSFQKEQPSPSINTWEFSSLSISVLEKLIALGMEEYHNNVHPFTKYIAVLFELDQSLYKAYVNRKSFKVDLNLLSMFFKHYQAQLYFHAATLMFKQAKRNDLESKEGSNSVLPLLFVAYHADLPDLNSMWLVQLTEKIKKLVYSWHNAGCYRNSQMGHIILEAAKSGKSWLFEKVAQYSSGCWRENLFRRLFVSREYQLKITTSFFVSNASEIEPTLKLPYLVDLLKYDENALAQYPDSLHHYIWVTLNNNIPDINISTFKGLQYSSTNLTNCGPEALNLLDIYSYVYCASLCANTCLKDNKYRVCGFLPPASIIENLATLDQLKFLKAAYKVYKNDPNIDPSERVLLTKGIETVRCMGHHGLDVKLLVLVAGLLEERAKKLTLQSEIDLTLSRSELYWSTAIPLLEKVRKDGAIAYPKKRMFEYQSEKVTPSEIQTFLDKGKLFIATQQFKKRDYERALNLFSELRDPYASYYQFEIYKALAEEQKRENQNRLDNTTDSYEIFLNKARDSLYLTLDRLRSPVYDSGHPLNSVIGSEIRDLENLISGREGRKLDFNDSLTSLDTNKTMFTDTNKTMFTDLQSTPLKLNISRQEARPSPERMDAQIRQIMATKDASVSLLSEQNRAIVDTQKSILDKLNSVIDDLRGLRTDIENLKETTKGIDDVRNTKDDILNMVDVIREIKKDLNEVKKNDAKNNQLSEEDLYALDADYGVDYNIAATIPANIPGTYPTYPGARIPNPNHIPAYGPSLMYPGLYSGLSYNYPGFNFAQPGSLPFLSEQQPSAVVPTTLPLSNMLPSPIASKFGVDLRKSQPPSQVIQLAKEEQPTPLVPSTIINQLKFTSASMPAVPSMVTSSPAVPLLNPSLSSVPSLITSVDVPSIVPSSTVPSLFTSSVARPFSTSSPIVQPLIPAAPGLHSTIFGKAPPVNVVITTSDPLPSKDVVTSQPVLSVTIPPQHMKSNFSKFGTSSSLVTGSPLIASSSADTSLLNQEKYLDKSQNLSSASINSLENEEPNIEFKPIIPLPDEVPFVTGEENEKELFNTRAKLFRHVNTNGNKEWKERGVGILKILQNQQTGKYRILMRRDQVLKICANHFIQNDFTLVSMPKSDKSFMWIAHDFSEGELQIETFCVKFKNAEEAKKFEEVVKKVKSAVQIKDQGTPEPKQLVSNTEKSASTLFQPPASTSLGGFVFTGTPTFKPKEIPPITSTPEQPPEPVKQNSPFSTFVFGKDNKKEEESKMFSPVVISQEKKDEADVEEFVPTAEFKPVVPLPELVAIKTGEENCNVLFSAKTKLFRYAPDLKEWKERGVGIIKILKDQDQIRLLMRRDQVHKVCCNHRVLKDMIFKTNSSKPQAIVWQAKDFSDEELKAETFTARFKTEESAKEFLQIVQDMQKSMNENNLITDSKDSNKKSSTQTKEVKPEIGFGDRFKLKAGLWECKSCLIRNEASAQNCVACNTSKDGTAAKPLTEQPLKTYAFGINTNASKSANESQPAVGFGETFKAKPGSWECQTCLIRNEGTVQECAACNTPKDGALPQTTKATGVGNLKLNPLSPFAFGFNINPVKPEKEKKSEVGFGDTFKAQPGSWECKTCLIRNQANVQKCVACDTIKEGAAIPAATATATSTVTSKWTFGVSNATPANGSQEPKTLFGSNATETKSLFSKTPTPAPAPAFFFGSNKTDEPKTSIFGDASTGLSGKNSGIVDSKWSFGQQSISIPSPNTVNQDIKTTPVKANIDNSESPGSFVFGSGQKEDFEFKQRTPRRISSGPGNEESDGSYVEEEEDTIYFKPIIPLPDKIQIKTGEENEDVLYCHRAKLFRFVSGEWKERGIGDVKILKNKSSQKLRVVMRREQVLKICLNHILSKDIEYVPKDERSFMFATADFAEGELVNEQFCLRFKNSEIANEFKKAVSDALGGATQKTKVSEPVAESDDEVIITHETHVTPEEEKLAISLGLPPKFMSYKQLPDCTCEQCKKDDEYLKDLFDASSDTNTVKNTFSFASQFALKPSVLASKSALSKPSDSTPTPFSFASANNPELVASNSTGKPFSSNSSIFGTTNSSTNSFTFKAFSGDPNNLFSSIPNPNTSSVSSSIKPFQFETKATFGNPSTTETKNIFADALSNSTVTGSKSIFGGAAPNSNVTVSKNIFAEPLASSTQISTSTSNIGKTNIFADPFSSGKSVFSNVAVSVPPKPEDTLPSKEKEVKEPVFKCDSGLSFASLAAATTSDAKPAFSKKADDAFLFLGAGAPVFGSQKSKLATDPNTSQNEDDCNNSNAEGDYDPHYEPIVPLPDQIVVTTGEEDEDILFNDRAKLFRYDTITKEWKERGIGQLKVLHHRQKNTYRLLLRREQVYKIVLNQLITTNFELQQMLTSNKAWMWAGNNFIEGEYCLEKLAVRFKNDELAVQFKSVIENVVTKLQTVPLKEQEDIPLYVENYEVEQEDDDVDGEEVEEESYKDENDINEEYIEEEEDDEDERTIMFMKECILSELSVGNEWNPVGQGDLQVYYDPELYAARIQVSDHTGKILSSTIIGVNTLMDIDKNECTWKATEWAASEIQWRNLKATFDSEPSAQEFHSNYLESLNYAQQVGLIDDLPDVFEPEN